MWLQLPASSIQVSAFPGFSPTVAFFSRCSRHMSRCVLETCTLNTCVIGLFLCRVDLSGFEKSHQLARFRFRYGMTGMSRVDVCFFSQNHITRCVTRSIVHLHFIGSTFIPATKQGRPMDSSDSLASLSVAWKGVRLT